jgi:hypothetical protein
MALGTPDLGAAGKALTVNLQADALYRV